MLLLLHTKTMPILKQVRRQRNNLVASQNRGPERTCIVTRQEGSVNDLIRFVAGPDGDVVPDLKRTLPGRGVWVTAKADIVREAIRRKAFQRGLKQEVKASETLPEMIIGALRQDVKQALALANKAGAIVSGFGQVDSAARSGQVRMMIHAVEAAEDGRRKLQGALIAGYEGQGHDIPIMALLSGTELELALGRSHVIHAALIDRPICDLVLKTVARLQHFCGEVVCDTSLNKDPVSTGNHDEA
jgi:uncharacterized protein